MSKKLAPPKWWKNTYFWIAELMVVVFAVGLIKGQEAIRDPGQKDEGGLIWIYLAGAAVMLVNGWISHKQYVQHYEEEADEEENKESSSSSTKFRTVKKEELYDETPAAEEPIAATPETSDEATEEKN